MVKDQEDVRKVPHCTPASSSPSSPINTTSNFIPMAPTKELEIFDPFIKWMLSHSPNEIEQRTKEKTLNMEQRLSLEIECEQALDCLSIKQREEIELHRQEEDLKDEQFSLIKQIQDTEVMILSHLNQKEKAITDKYSIEEQIEIIQQTSGNNTSLQLLLSALPTTSKATNTTSGMLRTTEKQVDKLQKQIIETKLRSAQVKTDLEIEKRRLKHLEKQKFQLKKELADCQNDFLPLSTKSENITSIGHLMTSTFKTKRRDITSITGSNNNYKEDPAEVVIGKERSRTQSMISFSTIQEQKTRTKTFGRNIITRMMIH
jgi:hypothetical protein